MSRLAISGPEILFSLPSIPPATPINPDTIATMTEPSTEPAVSAKPSAGLEMRRLGGATALMMAAILASRVVGYVREAYIAFAFGAGHNTDAFVTAFTIPDWLNYLVAGGSLSITFITIFSPFVAEHREDEGYRVFSVVATFMAVVLTLGVIGGEIFAPQLLRLYVPEFSPAQLAQCVFMTRVLLPAQLFFCIGGLLSATLYTRGSFLIPAMAPLVYNAGIILGGVVLGRWIGIPSLAVGAITGAVLGPFLLPLWGSLRRGLHYRPLLSLRDADFRRWIKLTLPLMIGISLVTADDWIMRPLAAHLTGAISHLNYAKRLIGVPIAVLGQAVGQASMPFFSWLATQNKWDEFRNTVDRSVVRTVTLALLASSWLAALSLPVVRVVYQRGHFHAQDAVLTAGYFLLFALSLIFWSSQSLYSRAFYAAGDTLTPMLKGTLVTICMIPLYILFAHHLGIPGLALASDLGILTHTVVLAWLLHRRNLLGMKKERWQEVPRVLLTALVAGGVTFELARRLDPVHYHWLKELGVLLVATLAWGLMVWGLSHLLRLDHLRDEVRGLQRKVLGRLGRRRPVADSGGAPS